MTHLETRERARAVGTDVQAACSRMRRCSSEGRDAKSVESTVRSDIVDEKIWVELRCLMGGKRASVALR